MNLGIVLVNKCLHFLPIASKLEGANLFQLAVDLSYSLTWLSIVKLLNYLRSCAIEIQYFYIQCFYFV